MKCRMTKEQRETLQELIDASVYCAIKSTSDTVRRKLKAMDKFERLFENQDNVEDEHRVG